MAKRKSSTVGPMSVQPNDRTYTARDQRAQPTIGEDQEDAPAERPAGQDGRRARRESKKSAAQLSAEAARSPKELIAPVDACSVWNQSPGRNREVT
jgi:hypothetical protein